jgi:hypothetical protein
MRGGLTLVDLADWSGLVAGRDDSFGKLIAVAPAALQQQTFSGPFRVTASDGQDYFVKSLDTCPAGHEASLAVEQIVSQAGRLIGAPVCDTSLIRIPSALAGWEPWPGKPLTEGLAHASLAVEHADFQRPPLNMRRHDNNPRRHVGVYALCDWCFSHDEQWLYDLDQDHAIYSHDHGLWLPPAGQGGFQIDALKAERDTPHAWRDPPNDLSPAATEEFADALEAVDRPSLVSVMCSIPASWPVTNEELEAVGWFLEYRTQAVADRVRALV